jgi:translocation and assembly module TamB
MTTPAATPATPAPPPPTPRWRRVARSLAIVNALVVVAAVALYLFVTSEAALSLAVRLAIARSHGELEIELPQGSLLSELRFKRLVWKGPEATVTADEVAINWTPMALWSRGIVIKGLGAQRISLTMQPSTGAVAPPASLELPTRVAIDEIAVAHFDWRIGPNGGTITGLTFGYTGGALIHRIDKLSLVSNYGTVTGELAMDARPPFAINGKVAFSGAAAGRDIRTDASVSGTLAAVAIDATGRAGEARVRVHAGLTPLAVVTIDNLALDAQDVDLSAWGAALPATLVNVKIDAHPIEGGLAGNLDAVNSRDGPLDGARLPVHALRARFAWQANAVTLDELTAEITGGGRANGRARIPLDGNAGQWTVDVRDVDLKRIYTPLQTTRLSGTLGANLESARQKIDGNLADRTIVGGIAMSFTATVADKRLAVERIAIRAGDGALAGSGRIDLAGRHAFDVVAKAKHIDPSRFGAYPAGSIDADIAANGTLDPDWALATTVKVVEGSRLAGVPLAGSARASLARRSVRDAVIDLKLASARLTASGNAGEQGEGLTVTLDAPQLGELVALLPTHVPRPLAGKLHANATLRGDFERGALELAANAEALKIGARLAIGTIGAKISVAPMATARATVELDERTLKVELAATDIKAPPGTFARAQASIEGTLAQHKASLSLVGTDLDIEASARGGLRDSGATPGTFTWNWAGSIDTLENRGPWAMRLAAPATFDFARDHVHIGAARLDVADGNVEVAVLAWDDGKISTRGAFSGVPVATVAKLAGAPFPFDSTLTLAGDWSLAAAPRLNGAFNVHREIGDISFRTDTLVSKDDRAMRITTLGLAAQFKEDAVEATATLRSERGLDADAQLAVGVAPDAPAGRLNPDAPLTFALRANLATLKVLQPWVGTTAIVDGNAHVDLTARGTLARAPLSGTLRGDALRIEAPQYGLFFTNGRLSAKLADGTLQLEELSFDGGAGRFTASGTLARAGEIRSDGQGAAARMTWHAEKFRVFNRPDLRLVVGGSGAIALKDRKITLDGTLVADEGHYEYESDARVKLGEDVVVKGWPASDRDGTRALDIPLAIDLELDFGDRLTFAGEGLETGLRGKVRVTTAPDGSIRGRGSIQAVNGTYFAFGQKLVIDRGRLIFDGPLDNPGLDIVALRKNLAVEAGVAVSGTVKVPIIQLTSNPPVPDNEKLSWLVLGHGIDRTSGADVAALQAASAALLGHGGKSVTTSVAQSMGLDDITVGSSASSRSNARGGTGTEAGGQVVAFGKRITDKLTLVYEQGLTVATNALRLEYALTKTLTLRAEAGAISGFGIYYRRTFD